MPVRGQITPARALLILVLIAVLALLHWAPDWFVGADAGAAKGISRRLLLAGALVALALLIVQRVWRPFVPNAAAVKTCFLGCIGVSGAVLLFLLPPFQGPDEINHWKAAISFSRARPEAEPFLQNLPEVLDAHRLPFYAENKFDPQKFRAAAIDYAPPPERPAFYASRLSYPTVTLVGLFFPRVQSIQEALVFYYLCRALGLLGLLAILYVALRLWDIPYSALVVFSFPLFLQQCSIISPDVLVNVGAIAAVLLFLKLWRARAAQAWPALPLYLLLWVVCLLCTRTKPIVAAMLLLPACLIPFRALPYRRFTIAALIAAVVLGGILATQFLMRNLVVAGGIAGAEDRAAQLALLQTVPGLKTFARLCYDYLSQLWDVRLWTSHLGWLDTPLNPHHLFLIVLSCGLAVVLDVWRYGAFVPEILLRRKALTGLSAGIIVAHTIFLSLSICAITYVGYPQHAPWLVGMQVRYFFPVAIVVLLLPLLLIEGLSRSPETETARQPVDLAANTAALVLLPFLLFARTVELVVDLTTRYW